MVLQYKDVNWVSPWWWGLSNRQEHWISKADHGSKGSLLILIGWRPWIKSPWLSIWQFNGFGRTFSFGIILVSLTGSDQGRPSAYTVAWLYFTAIAHESQGPTMTWKELIYKIIIWTYCTWTSSPYCTKLHIYMSNVLMESDSGNPWLMHVQDFWIEELFSSCSYPSPHLYQWTIAW